MSSLPITYVFNFASVSDKLRPFLMAEFVANGAKHLVLTSTLISQIMGSRQFGETLKKEMSEAGLTFVDSHAPFGPYEDLCLPDPAYRDMMIERLKLAIRIAADFGVDSITIHTGNNVAPWKGVYSVEQQNKCVLASLSELLPLAESLNVTIAIENIWFPNNTPEILLEAVHTFNSPCLGICYDSGHANLMTCDRGYKECAAIKGWDGYAPVKWDDQILEKILPEVTTCHLHDNHGQYDEHLLPGRGIIDWAHVASLLKTAPRLKCLQCETLPVTTTTSIADLCASMTKFFG